MNEEFTKVKLTIHIPFVEPNKNGCVFTEEAVEDAVNNLQKNIPIIYKDDESCGKVIGVTTGESHIVNWDYENNVCKMTVDGVMFNCNPLIAIHESEDGKISSFQIVSIGITT
jgi:hypothetical protein